MVQEKLNFYHASFTLSEESLKEVAEVHSKRSNWGIHTHLSEDRADEEDARNRGHASVVERLNHFGLINQNAMLIHGVHSLESDAELIQKHKAHLVHNPTSNANNRIGMLSTQAAERMKPGLGTDGMQSNMIREAKEGMLIPNLVADNLDGIITNVFIGIFYKSLQYKQRQNCTLKYKQFFIYNVIRSK